MSVLTRFANVCSQIKIEIDRDFTSKCVSLYKERCMCLIMVTPCLEISLLFSARCSSLQISASLNFVSHFEIRQIYLVIWDKVCMYRYA